MLCIPCYTIISLNSSNTPGKEGRRAVIACAPQREIVPIRKIFFILGIVRSFRMKSGRMGVRRPVASLILPFARYNASRLKHTLPGIMVSQE
jgi:hypothetical protein